MRKVVVVFEEKAYLAKVDDDEFKTLKKAVDHKDFDWVDKFLMNRKPLENPYKVEDGSWLLVVEAT